MDTNNSVIAEDLIVVYGLGNKFTAVFTDKLANLLNNVDVKFKVDDNTFNATTDSNGEANFTFDFNVGRYYVNIINPVTNQLIVRMIEVDANMTVFANNLTVVSGDGNVFVVNYTDKLLNPLNAVDVSVKIGESIVNATTDVDGTARFAINVKAGIYIVNITNPVTKQSLIKTITVNTNNTIVSSDVVVSHASSAKFIAQFLDKLANPLINANVTFKVNNNQINTTTDSNGSAGFDINFNPGMYQVMVVNPQTAQTVNNTLVVNKLGSVLVAPSISTTYNVLNTLIITLSDQSMLPVPDSNIVVNLNGATHNLKTDSNGQVFISTQTLQAGSYVAAITFAGDEIHSSSSTTSNIVINKASVKLTAKKAKLKLKTKTKRYSIVLKDNLGKAFVKAKVTLKVKNKKYKATTNKKGKATFKIKKLTK